MVGCFDCPITGVRLQVSDYSQLSDYTDYNVQNDF